MPPETIDRLRLALEDVLAASVNALTAPPARQYVSAGAPIVPTGECEELTVHAMGVQAAQLGSPSGIPNAPTIVVSVATVEVRLLRCAVTGPSPSGTQLHAEGTAHAVDGWNLWRGLLRAWKTPGDDAGSLFPQLPDVEPEAVTWVPGLEPLSNDGGFVGWTLTFTVRL